MLQKARGRHRPPPPSSLSSWMLLCSCAAPIDIASLPVPQPNPSMDASLQLHHPHGCYIAVALAAPMHPCMLLCSCAAPIGVASSPLSKCQCIHGYCFAALPLPSMLHRRGSCSASASMDVALHLRRSMANVFVPLHRSVRRCQHGCCFAAYAATPVEQHGGLCGRRVCSDGDGGRRRCSRLQQRGCCESVEVAAVRGELASAAWDRAGEVRLRRAAFWPWSL